MKMFAQSAPLLLVLILASCCASTTVDIGLEGTLLYERLDDDISQVVRLDLVDGSQQQVSQARTAPGAISAVEAPDGSAVLHAEFREDLGRVVVVLVPDGDGGSMVLSDTNADEALPNWSADCQSLFFARFTGDGNSAIWQMSADGSGRQLHFASSEGFATGPHQSLHHERLLFHSSHDADGQGTSIFAMDLGAGEPVRATPKGVNASWGRWSPVADEIAFQETMADGAMSRVSIVAGDGTGMRALTDFEEGFRIPVWSPDGTWVAFHRSDSSTVAVNVRTGEQVETGVDGLVTDWGPHDHNCPLQRSVGPRP